MTTLPLSTYECLSRAILPIKATSPQRAPANCHVGGSECQAGAIGDASQLPVPVGDLHGLRFSFHSLKTNIRAPHRAFGFEFKVFLRKDLWSLATVHEY